MKISVIFKNQFSSAKNTTLTLFCDAIPFIAYKYRICIAAFPLNISAVCLINFADSTSAVAFNIFDSKKLFIKKFTC